MTTDGKSWVGFAGVGHIDLDVFADAVVDAAECREHQEEMFGRSWARPV